MALAHRFGHLKGPPVQSPAANTASTLVAMRPVHLDGPVFRLQLGQKVGGRHRLTQDKHARAGDLRSIRLQGR